MKQCSVQDFNNSEELLLFVDHDYNYLLQILILGFCLYVLIQQKAQLILSISNHYLHILNKMIYYLFCVKVTKFIDENKNKQFKMAIV